MQGLKLLHINDIYKLKIAKMMFQFKYSCLPPAFKKLFTVGQYTLI